MKETVGLHSSFEDLYANRQTSPEVYSKVSELTQIPTEQNLVEQPVATHRIEVVSDPFDQIREAWQKEDHTPEFVTRISRGIFDIVKPEIDIPFTEPTAFPASAKEIKEHEVQGEIAMFQPRELATPEGRFNLAQAYKKFGNLYVPEHWSVQKGNNVKNKNIHAGWRWISGHVDAPHLDTSAKNAKKLMVNGYEGIDENEFLGLGIFMKATQDKYPDQDRTWTWVLNSSQDGKLVRALFDKVGRFGVRSLLDSDDHRTVLGVRLSSGVK